MPLTLLEIPILSQFLCAVHMTTGQPAVPQEEAEASTGNNGVPKKLPKGVVLGPDGKPCRSCTSFAAWAAMTKQQTASYPSAQTPSITSPLSQTPVPPSDCPADVEQLGRSSWTLLHTMAASLPERPSLSQQYDVKQFLSSFSRLYPCHWCATDFQTWMKEDKNAPRVSSRAEFGQWLCDAHNAVNEKLGKQQFDCSRWEERWRTGWKDGRCEG